MPQAYRKAKDLKFSNVKIAIQAPFHQNSFGFKYYLPMHLQ